MAATVQAKLMQACHVEDSLYDHRKRRHGSQFDGDPRDFAFLHSLLKKRPQLRLQAQAAPRAGLRQPKNSFAA